MNKHIIAFMLALAMVFTLSACGQSAPAQSSAPPSETPAPGSADAQAIEEPETQIVRKTTPIMKAQPFSEERAWVTYYDDVNGLCTGLIDTSGKLLGSFPGEAQYTSPVTDGYAFAIYSRDKTLEDFSFTIFTADGQETFSSEDYLLLGYGGGHFLAAQHVADFSTNEWRLGTIDAHGNTLNEFLPRISASGRTDWVKDIVNGIYGFQAGFSYNENYLDRFEYFGDNLMCLGRWNGYLYNISKNEVCDTEGYIFAGKPYEGNMITAEGYIIPADYAGGEPVQLRRSMNGEPALRIYVPPFNNSSTDLSNRWGQTARNDAYYLNLYSEGLFFGHSQGGAVAETINGYFNIKGERIISFPEFDWENQTGGPFSGGYAAMRIIGADGAAYITIINKTGTMMFEPMKVEAFNPLESCNGYAWVTIDGKGYIIDPQGNTYTAGVDDLSAMGNDAELFSGKGYPQLREGYFVIDNTYVSLDAQTVISEVILSETLTSSVQIDSFRVGIGVEPNYPFIEMAGEGVLTGFEPDLYEALIAYLNPENTYLDVVSATDWSTKLSTGAIDAAICALAPSDKNDEAVEFTDSYVTHEGKQYAIAVRKGDTELLNTLNAAIEALRENGDLDALAQKWFTNETPAASAQESEYEKLLNGDFSYFSGVWTNGEGVSFTLNKDGSITEPSGSKSYPGDVTLMNGYYTWSSQHPNYGGTHVTLFPIGISDSYGLGSDTSQIRIANGQSIPNSASELFLKTADISSDTNTQNTGGAFTEEQAIAYMTPLIIADWPQEKLTEGFIDSYADYTVAKSDKLYDDQPIYLIEYGVFRIGSGRALVFADGTVISRKDTQFSNYNGYFDIDITAYWPFS